MMKAISRVKIVRERTKDIFRGTYKGYDIDIERREPDGEDYFGFSILIQNPNISFGTAYDGDWGDPGQTIEEAVAEAFDGALLLEN